MAEITDRLPDAPPGSDLDTPLTPGADDRAAYRPLSMLALGGFALAVLSVILVCLGGWLPVLFNTTARVRIFFVVFAVLTPAAAALVRFMLGNSSPVKVLKTAGIALAGALAVLGLGGLLVYSSSDPWLLPRWALVVPAAGVIALWIARSQILRSENTISGLPLCNLGIGLIAVFGLMYGAYYGATVLAVRNQSEAFADEWVSLVQNGELDKAYARVQIPDQRPPEDANLRMRIETYFNQPNPNHAGPFTEFTTRDYIRLVEGTKDTSKIEPLGLIDWDYDAEGFSALYGYRLSTAVCTVDLEIGVRGGRENRLDPSKGRQWYIETRRTGWSEKKPPDSTVLGIMVTRQNNATRDFITDWFTKWYHDEDDAWLLTLPPAQRREVIQRRPILGTALGGTALLTEPGRQAFYNGALLDGDHKRFFAMKEENRKAVPAALKRAFWPGEDKPNRAEINKIGVAPLVQEIPNGVQVTHDIDFYFDEAQKDVRLVNVDARIVLECDTASLATPEPQWQVKKIELIRARSSVAAPGDMPAANRVKIPIPKPQ